MRTWPSPRRPIDGRDVLIFFVLTGLLTTPFWLAGAMSGIGLLPGLPLAALGAVCPAIAALVLAWRRGGPARGRALLRRALDVARVRPKFGWLPILLISPAVSVGAFMLMRLGGSGVPAPRIDILSAAALFAVFMPGALGEELGWTGFALDPLQSRLGFLPAALTIGAVWALWHYPALLQAGRSLAWIAWWSLGTVATRVVMVWLYNNTGGSVFGVAVFHALGNLCWQLFPTQGSWFDPRLNGLLMAAVAAAALLATITRSGEYRKSETP